jgi:predicted HicB family RNase H-like nuclease
MDLNVSALGKAEREIYEEARELLETGTGVTAFVERFFGPAGKLAAWSKNEAERGKLVQSELYQWLQRQAAELRRQEAQIFERDAEACSGRLTITVPRSLHAALKQEARWEGVSLSELIRLKLAVPFQLAIRTGSSRR